MAVVRVKGFAIWQDRKLPFKWRCRHRKTGTMLDLAQHPLGSLSFFAECSRIAALIQKADEPKPGTLGQLVARYRAGTTFADLATRTRDDYQRCFDYLQPIADTSLDRFSAPLIVRIRDKAAAKHGRRFGNYVKTVLALTFAWGLERGYVKNNPAVRIKGIRRPRGAPDANRPWSDSERNAVSAALPSHMTLPVALMMYCGLDPQDAIRLPRTAVSDGMINARRGKTGEAIWLPLPSPVVDALASAAAHDAITCCANSRGKPWSVSGFRASWRPIRMKLETAGVVEKGLTLKGLRHTVATILAEMGYDDRTIADMLSQKTEAMARLYSRRANKTRKLSAVVKDFEAEVNRRRTKAVKPS
ncbi:tyrosine-type recombinase/integrase [Mesorhizobium marinum]|uniref:tyrosine-type recombinase/integrase n=1 Tax=Mesorhizobium marinum TaxID=3228790 RepID=UPI003466BB50